MCLFPIRATFDYYQDKKTGMPVREAGKPKLDKEGELQLPCGKCRECISKRAVEWATRARHEISLHKQNSFITLTYNPENLPSKLITQEVKNDFKLFMKRLRKKSGKSIRYMVSYEYGSQFLRPHFHAIIFGWSPSNLQYWDTTQAGSKIYRSEELEALWDKGYSSVGEANEKTAYYIASYALKGKEHEIIHPETGEQITVRDSMTVSNRPAIGLKYLLKNAEQIVNSDDMLPRYYMKNLEDDTGLRHQRLLEKYPEYADTIKKFPYLALEAEQKLQSSFKNRSSHEKFAKFKNDLAKSNLSSNTFRESNNDHEKQKIKLHENALKTERDNYVTYNRE